MPPQPPHSVEAHSTASTERVETIAWTEATARTSSPVGEVRTSSMEAGVAIRVMADREVTFVST